MKKFAILPLLVLTLAGTISLARAAEPEPAKQESDKASAENVRQKLNEAAVAIRNYSAEKRDEAANTAGEALDELDARIDALEQQIDRDWDKMDQAARTQARASLKTLQEKRIQAAEWYGGLKNSTAAAWEEMKKGFADAYQSLQQAWEKAEQRSRETDENK